MGFLDLIEQIRRKNDRRHLPMAPAPAAPPPSTDGPSGAATGPSRRTIEAPVLRAAPEPAADVPGARIKAMDLDDGERCRFMLDRPLFEGRSWWVPGIDASTDAPLAAALFAHGVEAALIHDSSVTVTWSSPTTDWKTSARQLGPIIRAHLDSGVPCVNSEVEARLLSDHEYRAQVQRLIDDEINPGVEAHGGYVTLMKVEANSITIEMGGGCQGCSAASVTLRSGIEGTLRDHIPTLGAVLDATDHGAGQNPYFR